MYIVINYIDVIGVYTYINLLLGGIPLFCDDTPARRFAPQLNQAFCARTRHGRVVCWGRREFGGDSSGVDDDLWDAGTWSSRVSNILWMVAKS